MHLQRIIIGSCSKSFRRFCEIFQSLNERTTIKVLRAHPSFAEYYQAFVEQGNALIRALKPYKVKVRAMGKLHTTHYSNA